MNLIKVVFDTKGRRDREGGKKRIKRLDWGTFKCHWSQAPAYWQALFAFNDGLSGTDYALNTCWLKRCISIFPVMWYGQWGGGFGSNDWDKQHFVSLNHTVWLRNDPRLCSQTWHLGLRTDLPRSVPPWFSHAERAQVDGHERIHLSNSQSFTAIDSRCQWEGFELLCALPKEACSLFLEREAFYTHKHSHTHIHFLLPACLLLRHITQFPSPRSLPVKGAHSAADAIGQAAACWDNVHSNPAKVVMFHAATSVGFECISVHFHASA